MAKFTPSEHVEVLEYDFEEYGGSSGVIAEPTQAQVNGYFNAVRAVAKESKQLRDDVSALDGDAELSEEETMAALDKVDEISEGSQRFQERIVEALAALCGGTWNEESQQWEGGSPTFEELQRLPMRVMSAFNQWLVGEINPKRTTPGSKR